MGAEEGRVFPMVGGEPEEDAPSEPPAAEPNSILEAVQAEWEKHAQERYFDYTVPGTGQRLVLRLGPLPGGMLSRLRERLERSKNPERDVNLNADVLIAACRGVYGRTRPGAPLEELGDDDGPYGLDVRLGKALPYMGEPDTARAVVRGLFSGANDPGFAVVAAGAEYIDWAGSSDADVSEDLLGES